MMILGRRIEDVPSVPFSASGFTGTMMMLEVAPAKRTWLMIQGSVRGHFARP
jgi:hypothetical protein